MTLALTMGMSIGYRRTLWMMVGELLGVAAVSLAAILGIAAVMLKYPEVFTVFKAVGATYLFYLGIQMWRSRGKLAITSDVEQQRTQRLGSSRSRLCYRYCQSQRLGIYDFASSPIYRPVKANVWTSIDHARNYFGQ